MSWELTEVKLSKIGRLGCKCLKEFLEEMRPLKLGFLGNPLWSLEN